MDSKYGDEENESEVVRIREMEKKRSMRVMKREPRELDKFEGHGCASLCVYHHCNLSPS